MKKEIRNHTNSYCLPSGTLLNQRYTLMKVLGEGGFGITYLGRDEVLQSMIAVKEFYPEALVGRNVTRQEEGNIYIHNGLSREAYEKSLKAFLQEARNLSQFLGTEGIVQVRDYFQENGTAYIIMEYIDGISIKQYVQKNGPVAYDKVLEMMEPVLRALQNIHKKQIIHRDLSADNIMITEDVKIKLIDFGSARYTTARENRTMTVLFKRGFAAEEQYRQKGNQGTWTDVYGISAAMYYMMAAEMPEESVERVIQDKLVPLADRKDIEIPGYVSDAISKGMAVMAKNRYQTIEELYEGLYYEPMQGGVLETAFSENIVQSEVNHPEKRNHTITRLGKELQLAIKKRGIVKNKRRKYVGAIIAVLVGVLIITAFVRNSLVENGYFKESQEVARLSPEKNIRNTVSTSGQAVQKQDSGDEIDEIESDEIDSMVAVVPDILECTQKQAKKKLKKAGLIPGKVRQKYSAKKKGTVIEQEIPSSKKILEGESVDFVISKGKKETVQPSAKPTESTTNTPATQKPDKSGEKDDVVGSLNHILN